MEVVLRPHHGIMYRRAELEELIALHFTTGELGGDLQSDTVTIIGATLYLEKAVRQAVTKTSMLNIDAKPDIDTMELIERDLPLSCSRIRSRGPGGGKGSSA